MPPPPILYPLSTDNVQQLMAGCAGAGSGRRTRKACPDRPLVLPPTRAAAATGCKAGSVLRNALICTQRWPWPCTDRVARCNCRCCCCSLLAPVPSSRQALGLIGGHHRFQFPTLVSNRPCTAAEHCLLACTLRRPELRAPDAADAANAPDPERVQCCYSKKRAIRLLGLACATWDGPASAARHYEQRLVSTTMVYKCGLCETAHRFEPSQRALTHLEEVRTLVAPSKAGVSLNTTRASPRASTEVMEE